MRRTTKLALVTGSVLTIALAASAVNADPEGGWGPSSGYGMGPGYHLGYEMSPGGTPGTAWVAAATWDTAWVSAATWLTRRD